LLFTIVPAIFAGIENLPKNLQIHSILTINQLLPFSSMGLGWIIPALIGLIVGYILSKLNHI